MRHAGRVGVVKGIGLAIVGAAVLVWVGAGLASRGGTAQAAAAEAAKPAESDGAKAQAAPAADKNASSKKANKEKAKPRGRLPAYFVGVVDDEQRDKIYAIQKDFEPKINQVKQQLESLTKARDEKINALLSPEQKKKIDDAKAAAKQAREKKASGDTTKLPKKEAKEKKATKRIAKEKSADPTPQPQPTEPAK